MSTRQAIGIAAAVTLEFNHLLLNLGDGSHRVVQLCQSERSLRRGIRQHPRIDQWIESRYQADDAGQRVG